MDFVYSIVAFFATGGAFMYPILLVFAVGAAISIERFITLQSITNENQAAWKNIQPALSGGDFDKARELTSEDQSPVSRNRPSPKFWNR